MTDDNGQRESNGQTAANGRPIPDVWRNRDRIRQAMGEAVQNAVRTHKLLGHSIIIWKDGKVVEVPPEEIEVDDLPPANAG